MDRDGVINVYRPGRYVSSAVDFEFAPRALDALQLLHRKGYKVVVISNQAGVGKGRLAPVNLRGITDHMLAHISERGGRIEEVVYCVHAPEDDCACRKPRPGMILDAAARHGFVLGSTWFIGDNRVDFEAARAAGCRSAIVLTGKTSREELDEWAEKPDWSGGDLLDAALHILHFDRTD